MVSVPFIAGQHESVQRASWDQDGGLVHHLPPQYHGDPMSQKGILCFREFAWDFLDDLLRVGFSAATGYAISSIRLGYVGAGLSLFARK